MAKFGMDLRKFRKIKSGKSHSILQHEDGHELKIAHSALNENLRSQLDALPMAKGGQVKKYAKGEEVESGDEENSSSEGISDLQSNQPQSEEQATSPEQVAYQSEMTGLAHGVPHEPGFGEDESLTTSKSSADMTIPGEEGPVDSGIASQPNQMENPLMAGVSDIIGGQKNQQYAIGQLGRENVQAEKQFRNEMQSEQQKYQESLKPFVEKSNELSNWLSAHPENANNYVDKMSTGHKIRTAIGLILGGMGSGLTHGPNLAFKYLQDQIDRDIASQKETIGTKKGLLAHNLDEMKNMRSAELLTRMQHNDALASVLRQNAAKASTAQAAGAAQALEGMLKQQNAQLANQAALNNMLYGGSQMGALIGNLPEKDRERVVQMPDGGIRLALDKKGAEELRGQLGSITPIYQSLDELSKLGPSALIKGTAAYNKANAVRSQLIPLVNENAGLKRLSHEDVENIQNMFTDPTKFSQLLTGSVKTEQFKKFLNNKLESAFANQLQGGYRSSQQKQSSGNFNFKSRKD